MKKEIFDPYDFSKKTIDGVDIYYKNLPWAPCIHVRIVFNTGAFNDPVGKEGLSHFFEHMIFDGSPTLPNKKAIREWSKIHTLNTWNAWTSFHNTVYWLKCLPEEFGTALSGMKDMLFRSLMRPEDIEHERKVITQEAWNKLQNEKYLKYCKEVLDNLYHGHDWGRFESPLGWPETIAKISTEDVVDWYKKHYGIGNFFIVLTGAVQEKHIDKINEFLKDLPKVTVEKKDYGVINKPKQSRFVKVADEIGEIKEQVEISFGRASGKMPHEGEEIKNIFVKLAYDLLNERLRIEHSLCYNVNVLGWYEKSYSLFASNIKTDEKNIEIVEKEFRNVINEIINGKHLERFNLVKKVYAEQIRSSEKLSADIADTTLREIVKFDGHIVTQKEQLEKIEKVKYDDVAKLAKWAFDPEFLFTEIILPSKK